MDRRRSLLPRRGGRRLTRRALLSLLPILVACSSTPAEELAWLSDDPWPDTSFLPPFEGPRLVVTNSGDDTLSFVDPVSFVEIARIPVGLFPVELEGPHHVAPTPDGRFLFVGISNSLDPSAVAGGPHGSHGAGTADGYLLKLDARTGRLLGRSRVDRSPGDIRMQPGGKRVWQTHYDLVTVAEALAEGRAVESVRSTAVVTDTETMERIARVEICPTGHGIGFSPDGSEAYVTCSWTEEVAIVDTATFEVAYVHTGPEPGSFPMLRYQPYALAVAPDGRVWVSNTGPVEKSIRVIDPARRQLVEEPAVLTDGVPYFGAFTEDGSRFFVVTQNPDRLLAIDPGDGTELARIDLGALGCLNAHAAVVSPDQRDIWVVCEGDRVSGAGSLERFDAATLTHTGHVQVGIFPDDVAWIPEVR